jgi:signal peptidase I
MLDSATSAKTGSTQPAHRTRRWSERLFVVGAAIFLFLLAWQLLANKIGPAYQVPGRSMEPTIRAGERIIANHDYYKRRPLAAM